MQAAPICCRHSCHARRPLRRGAVRVRECQPSRAKPHPLSCLIMSECHLALPPLLPPHTQKAPELEFPTPGLQNGRSQIGPDASHPSMCWPLIRSQEPSCGSWKWKWGYIRTAKPLPEVCGGDCTYRELYITLATAVTTYMTSPIMSQWQSWGWAADHQHLHSLEFPLYTKSGVTAANLSASVWWWVRGRFWV